MCFAEYWNGNVSQEGFDYRKKLHKVNNFDYEHISMTIGKEAQMREKKSCFGVCGGKWKSTYVIRSGTIMQLVFLWCDETNGWVILSDITNHNWLMSSCLHQQAATWNTAMETFARHKWWKSVIWWLLTYFCYKSECISITFICLTEEIFQVRCN